MKKFLSVILATTLFTGAIVSAASLDNKKAQYDAAAQKAKKASDLIQDKIDSVSEVKRVLDEEADVAVSDYNEKQSALDETVERIEENESKLENAEEDYKKKHAVLEKRVRDIYINGQISYIDVLFGAQDFGDFLTRMDLLKRVMIQDSALVNDILNYKNEIIEVGKQLEADRKIQTELAERAEVAKNIKLEKVAKQQALIDRMQNDKAVYDRQYDEMMAASKEVEQMIQNSKYRASNSSTYKRKNSDDSGGYVQSESGNMIWPLQGPITSPFGWRTHPIFGTKRFHSGLDIGGDYGLEIHAAKSGVVTHAGWIGGYGNTVMIDHGGGVVTLYGHNQSLAVSVGENVRQGQVISYCGSTGNSTGPHCHFEVRLNGEPVSPYNYL